MRIGHLVEQSHWHRLVPAIDAIFFEASGVKTFADDADRAAFHERWLGRYLARWPEHVFVARDDDGTLAGYLTGCLDDPATSGRFDDIAYYQNFAAACVRYPAHLHINLAPAYRGQGAGGLLLEAFAGHAARAGAPGMHIVTGAGARNVRFYERCGFRQVATAPSKGNTVAFMGRALNA